MVEVYAITLKSTPKARVSSFSPTAVSYDCNHSYDLIAPQLLATTIARKDGVETRLAKILSQNKFQPGYTHI